MHSKTSLQHYTLSSNQRSQTIYTKTSTSSHTNQKTRLKTIEYLEVQSTAALQKPHAPNLALAHTLEPDELANLQPSTRRRLAYDHVRVLSAASDGATALMRASQRGHEACARLLRNAADVD